MATEITREVIESFLNCKYKSHLKLNEQAGTKSEYESLLIEQRNRVGLKTIATISANFPTADIQTDIDLTTSTLKRGSPYFFNVKYGDDQIRLVFDGLKRVSGPSKLGAFHYLPFLFFGGEKAGLQQRILLEIYGLILGEIQGFEPRWGVLAAGHNCQIRKVQLRPAGLQARRILQELKGVQEAKAQPPMMLNTHCDICEFRKRCQADAANKDDLSLLRTMSESEVKKYVRRGIFTVTQLSCTFRAAKNNGKSKRKPRARQHALQALAIREKKIYILGSPELPADSAQIYVDMEGDPDRNFVYLIGLLVVRVDGTERYSFWADTPDGERSLLIKTLGIIACNEPCSLFAYGGYEAAFFRRMMTTTTSPPLNAEILARLVNVLSVIHSHVFFPTYSNGLKDIGDYLGFCWTEPDASGIQSIVWRRRWEETGDSSHKDKLITYNLEDCEALRKVTDALRALCCVNPAGDDALSRQNHEICRVEDIAPHTSRREWCQIDFAIPEFNFVNERAYFDYQRDRVFIRTSKTLKASRRLERRIQGKKNLRANATIVLSVSACPGCGETDLSTRQDGRLKRVVYDLQVRRSGIRRHVTHVTTSWHRCRRCQKWILPNEYLRLREYGHSLKSWAMYEHIAHRATIAHVSESIQDCFGLPVSVPFVFGFKRELARYYEGTYSQILQRITSGSLIHADETEVHLRKAGKGYVWVFTNLEDVALVYRKTREGDFLHDFLKDFQGVLVSDFYSAYDSLGCPQQKCLIHLIRDFNQDIRGNPWDDELKSLAGAFGKLLRQLVATVDQHGLKAKYLGKHRRAIDRFFDFVQNAAYRSEATEAYRKRLLKNRGKLFTFIDHDNVPWNNNNAEHAVKQFAYYREYADGLITETGLQDYLVLLSVYQTCRYKKIPFLRFLLSRETDIEVFRNRGRWQLQSSSIEVHPPGWTSQRQSRNKVQKRLERQNNAPGSGR